MLALNPHVLRLQVAVGHHFGEILNDVGLRSNGICCDHLNPSRLDGLGHGAGALNHFSHALNLRHHRDVPNGALVSADAAPLAVVQVYVELLLVYREH